MGPEAGLGVAAAVAVAAAGGGGGGMPRIARADGGVPDASGRDDAMMDGVAMGGVAGIVGCCGGLLGTAADVATNCGEGSAFDPGGGGGAPRKDDASGLREMERSGSSGGGGGTGPSSSLKRSSSQSELSSSSSSGWDGVPEEMDILR
jgi:hypothetical protein